MLDQVSRVKKKPSRFTYDISRQEKYEISCCTSIFDLLSKSLYQLKFCNVGLYCVLWVTVKEGTPEDDDLQGLAMEIVEEWKELGRRLLDNDEAKLYAIHKENEKYSEKAYKMLLKWKREKGSGATFQVLHCALCHPFVNRKDLAETFCLVDHD